MSHAGTHYILDMRFVYQAWIGRSLTCYTIQSVIAQGLHESRERT